MFHPQSVESVVSARLPYPVSTLACRDWLGMFHPQSVESVGVKICDHWPVSSGYIVITNFEWEHILVIISRLAGVHGCNLQFLCHCPVCGCQASQGCGWYKITSGKSRLIKRRFQELP